ncbi:tyrosine-type recombinase/integrase [Bifidobacterium cuniculi]|uniref:Phage integrase family site-specific recombinase n=1 Tax=Bifidobacterium cuniculi TaxID=1688 RepID=A0A087B4X3_9BIFI|nr:tyrosine-type recombinase/integrase [Bifidobacterium cuniculi]KFI66073.1 phage integrase family site-specific recombinase [Bifidobacterium cuniculi]
MVEKARAPKGAPRPKKIVRKRVVKHRDGTVSEREVTVWRQKVVEGVVVEAKTLREVLAKASGKRRELQETGHVSVRGRKPVLHKYIEMFLELKEKELAPKTMVGYRVICRRLDGACGQDRVDSFTPMTLRLLLERLWGEKSFSTRKHAQHIMSQIFGLAVDDGVIMVNPMAGVKVKQPRGSQSVDARSAFSVPELKMMLMVSARWPLDKAARMWFRIFTGARQGEILGAVAEDLHLDAPVPYYDLRWALTEVTWRHGCGSMGEDGRWACGRKRGGSCPDRRHGIPRGFVCRELEGRWMLKLPKSYKPRTVPLVPELVEVMRRYLDYVAAWPNPHGLLFRHEDGSLVTGKEDTADFKELLVECGMDPEEHQGHETRHSAVTILRKAHADTKTIMEVIGHSSLAVDDLYMHVDDEQKSEAMNVLGDVLSVPKGLLPGE